MSFIKISLLSLSFASLHLLGSAQQTPVKQIRSSAILANRQTSSDMASPLTECARSTVDTPPIAPQFPSTTRSNSTIANSSSPFQNFPIQETDLADQEITGSEELLTFQKVAAHMQEPDTDPLNIHLVPQNTPRATRNDALIFFIEHAPAQMLEHFRNAITLDPIGLFSMHKSKAQESNFKSQKISDFNSGLVIDEATAQAILEHQRNLILASMIDIQTHRPSLKKMLTKPAA